MKLSVFAGLAAVVALAGCATGGTKMTPEQVQALAKGFHDAGCGGRFDLDTGAASGQIGGEAHIQLGLHGECPVGTVPKPAPIDPAVFPAFAPLPPASPD